MKKLLYLIGLTFLLVACGNEETNSDETKNYKETTGEITNENLLINLAVRSEAFIEATDNIDGVKVDEDEITATKLNNRKDTNTSDLYENIYQVEGVFSWNGEKYDFKWTVAFEDNDVSKAGKFLVYQSEQSKIHEIVDTTTVE
ncbi:hypothetical protein MKX73_19605 [Solibacillus sp. FSL W7-1436]|uniref:hypothetical protein n=1 Tax=Solibacillus sp. FSL W7-1436 TaxID=2921705 RepID=UPI0030FA9155